ncbi:integrin alpha-4-like [Scylla paramamosain]|uniref:integrin alpha-4-like n=1 Tax=Scylla paramamosain TaxID=85552 RepID=UPI0030831EA7
MLKKLLLLFVISCSSAYNVEVNWAYVLSNPDKWLQEREGYFGYTVSLFTSSSSSWALVGAPRANDTKLSDSNVKERGAVYLCELPATKSSCRQLIVTDAANGLVGGGGNLEYEILQDYGWLGGSLDLRPDNPDSTIVTCSPRWTNQKYSYNDYFVNGACYLTSIGDITDSAAATKPWSIVTPLVDSNRQVVQNDNGVNVFYYQLGQAGLSVHVAEGKEQVWLGAPGMQQWTGSVSRVWSTSSGPFTYMRSETFKPAAKAEWGDYFGYSVGSGRFFGSETQKVAGSPRHELVGKVSVFTTDSVTFDIQVQWEATGPQVGSYFGAAVAAGDVDGDGWSELFVGAPLFTVGPATEAGLVIIYSRNASLGILKKTGSLIGPGKAGARFGSALMVVGDLDRDGYQDVAVGAPYEAGGAGAVYIYRGYAGGLLTTYSQKVSAKDIDLNLRGFGISISRGVDVDRNGYADFAAGAYEGDGAAVVLRTRPVMRLELRVSSDSEILTEPGITFPVQICISYTGFKVLDEIHMTLEGLVDNGAAPPRAVFVDSGTPQATFDATVRKGRDNCQVSLIKLQDNIENDAQSLEVFFTVKETNENAGCETCGIISPESKLRSKVDVPLVLGCGADAVCTPELDLAVTWKGASQLALRSGATATLSVVVSVTGKEYSYVGIVLLVLPEGFTVHYPLPYSCSSTTGDAVYCTLPSPMAGGEKTELEISVKESEEGLVEGEVPFRVSCSARGTQDVEREVTLSVIEDVELALSVYASEDMIEYGQPPPASPAATMITYQVINRGESSVNEVRLDMVMPMEYDGTPFVHITQQETSSRWTSQCDLEDSAAGHEPGSDISDPPIAVTHRVVCGQLAGLACKRVTCIVQEVHLDPIITVEVVFNTTALTENLGADDATIAIYTSAAASYGSPTPTVYTESGEWVTLTPTGWRPPAKSTPAWPYVVAALVGLLILAAVVAVLFKIGFFKRKRPGQTPENAAEDLEGQAEGDEATPFQSTEPESEGEAARMTTAEVEAGGD